MQNNVRKLRRDLEWSQEKLAQKAGTSRQTIISIEKGHAKDVSYILASNIAFALGKPVQEVFFAKPVTHVKQKSKTG